MDKNQVSEKAKQPKPIDRGWSEYKEFVSTHLMNDKKQCLTHENCHLESFFPGNLFRKMQMKRNKDGLLVMDKEIE